jgi:aminoglycoside phosphotransferase (APT) family kinase protein
MWPAASPPTKTEVAEQFGIDVGELQPHEGGYEADAFTDGRWFLKLFRGRPPADAALSITSALAIRGLPVPAARRAVDGGYRGEHDGRRFAVYPYVAGRVGTWDDADAIARSMRVLHDIADLDLPCPPIEESCIAELRAHRDHPWLDGWRDEVMAAVDRLEVAIERANAHEVPRVAVHHDLLPHNTLVDDDGEIAAVLDWDYLWLAPKEHDLFAAFGAADPARFFRVYGVDTIDRTHIEYALLARAVRDFSARVCNEVDREGLWTWGIDALRRVDERVAQASRFS